MKFPTKKVDKITYKPFQLISSQTRFSDEAAVVNNQGQTRNKSTPANIFHRCARNILNLNEKTVILKITNGYTAISICTNICGKTGVTTNGGIYMDFTFSIVNQLIRNRISALSIGYYQAQRLLTH